MPKHRKGKGKATAPMAVPSLDNRPRYHIPEVQVSVPQLLTAEPTPAVKTRNWQLLAERKLAAEVSVSDRLVRVLDAIVREALAWADLRKPVASVLEKEEEEESTCGGIRDEDQIFSGPWWSKRNPTGFLDSDNEEVVDQMGCDWRERRIREMIEREWEDVAGFLLTHTVAFVDSELVETEKFMQGFDLILRIIGKNTIHHSVIHHH